MGNPFIGIVSTLCSGRPALESAIRRGYAALCESEEEESDFGPILEDGDDSSAAENNTITMDLDSLANNADQIQAVLQKKKEARANDKAADEQLVALGNSEGKTI